MAGYRFFVQCGLAVSLMLTIVQAGRSQTSVPPVFFAGTFDACCVPKDTCKVYSLADLGDDPAMCKWIAETIPQMIQPATWKGADGKAKLSYFAPGKVMVINQTPAVHAQIEEFLTSMKKSLPQAKAKRDPQVMPAQFAVPDNARMVGASQAHPSPQAPKHLFHFILGVGLRYEGEGIIDSNVVKFVKELSGQGACGQTPTLTQPSLSSVPTRIEQTEAVSPFTIGDTVPSGMPQSTTLRHPPQYVPPPTTAPRMPLADVPPNSVPPMPNATVPPRPPLPAINGTAAPTPYRIHGGVGPASSSI